MVLDSQKRYADTAEFSCRPHPTSPIANILTLLCLVAQSCLTLCNPMDCSPPASSVHGNPTGKNTRVGCHALLNILHSVQFSRSVVSDSLRPRELQHARTPCTSPTPGVHSNSCPSSRWCHPAISSSSSPSSPAPNPSQHQDLFQWVSSSHEVTKVLEFQL